MKRLALLISFFAIPAFAQIPAAPAPPAAPATPATPRPMATPAPMIAQVGPVAPVAPTPPPPPHDDPIGRYLIPPDLVMAHSQEIGLQEKQRAAIKSEVQKAQSKFIDAQWDLKEETETMVKLLQQTPADEARILAQADKVMGLEREIKKTQLALLVRIKNVLTAEQLAKLEALRRKW